MNITTIESAEVPLKNRNSFKLLLLFILTFLAVFLIFVAYNVFTSLAEQKAAEVTVPNQPTVVQIDPKMETEMARVLAFGEEAERVSVKDPFNDRSGISGLTAVQRTTGTGGTGSGNAVAQTVTDSAGNRPPSGQGQTGGTVTNAGSGNRPPGNGSTDEVRPDTKTRLDRWMQSATFWSRSEPDAQIFAVDDLIPVGLVSGGSAQEEVIFYSQAANRTLSFPVGTRFYDAWLAEVTPDGVIFNFEGDSRALRLKSWGRSLNMKSGKIG